MATTLIAYSKIANGNTLSIFVYKKSSWFGWIPWITKVHKRKEMEYKL